MSSLFVRHKWKLQKYKSKCADICNACIYLTLHAKAQSCNSAAHTHTCLRRTVASVNTVCSFGTKEAPKINIKINMITCFVNVSPDSEQKTPMVYLQQILLSSYCVNIFIFVQHIYQNVRKVLLKQSLPFLSCLLLLIHNQLEQVI